jgi:hypothetical protein
MLQKRLRLSSDIQSLVELTAIFISDSKALLFPKIEFDSAIVTRYAAGDGRWKGRR